MQTVSRFEANLLRLLYYFLGQEPPERALPLLEARCVPPKCLSRAAVRLTRAALAKGCVRRLARGGGWRTERHLRGGRVVEGRLWERTPPAELGLAFSGHTLRFLIWITSAQPRDKDGRWQPPAAELASGDLLLLFFAHEGLRPGGDSLGIPELRRPRPFAEHGLCRLAYPDDFTATPETLAPDFAPWLSGVGSAILEALQPELAARWVRVESAKGSITDSARMRDLGVAQERVLGPFLDALEQAGRPDLGRFLLTAASRLLGPHAEPGMWVGALQHAGERLADRTAVVRHALAFLRCLERLQGWERRARGVGYFDEGYAAAQLWKADWEQFQGDALCQRAQGILRRLDPLRQG